MGDTTYRHIYAFTPTGTPPDAGGGAGAQSPAAPHAEAASGSPLSRTCRRSLSHPTRQSRALLRRRTPPGRRLPYLVMPL